MSGAPAGWYPDPQGERAQRYWDGLAWTTLVCDDRAVPVSARGAPSQPSVQSSSSADNWATPRARAEAKAQKLALMYVPLVSLPALPALNARAVPLLRAAGLKAGLFGLRW